MTLTSSLYTKIPHSEGIEVLFRYHEKHYEYNPPIPANDLRELMRFILEENSFKFKFNERSVIQTHAVAMGTKIAVAFSFIFMVVLEKRLPLASPAKSFVWKYSLMTFSLWKFPMNEVSVFDVGFRYFMINIII